MSNLYNRIMELCEKRGITPYRLCKDIGIRASTITDLKMGRKKGLSAEVADKMARYFDVSVSFLLDTEETKNVQPTGTNTGELDDVLTAARDNIAVRALLEEAVRANNEDIDAVTNWLRRLRENSES